MDKARKRLGFKLLAITLLAIAAGVGIYFAAQGMLTRAIDYYLSDGTVQQKRLEQSAESLQEYATSKGVTLADKEELDKWVQEQQYVMLQVYRGGNIMYDSTMEENMSDMGMAGGDAMQWQRSFPITFADGVGDAIIYGYYQTRDYQTAVIVSVIFGTVTFAILLLVLVGRKTKYISQLSDELHILEGGDLGYHVTVKGKDELGDLAQSIDDMRRAMIERQQNEEHMREMNRELVTSMSHDLRSPLTSLIGYLDILELGKYRTEEEKERFLKNSHAKAYQIKELSDKLFEYFLLYDGKLESPEMERYASPELLRDLIGDAVFELRSVGFDVEYTPLKEPSALHMMADQSMLRRVFDNLFVNIRKYADAGQPVQIVCAQNGKELKITLINGVKQQTPKTAGTGIGLKLAKRIIEAHQGVFSCMEEDGRFIVNMTLCGE